MTSNNKFLIVIYTVTAGQHHEELGSDEQEIVLFAYLVLDIVNLKVRERERAGVSLQESWFFYSCKR